ncbi:hypothetical protein PMAYCL1PPCAC_20448, partial [Pristionchus mayeri]
LRALVRGMHAVRSAPLTKASTNFHNGVREFMSTADSRPGVNRVDLTKTSDGMWMAIELYPSNPPFYGVNNLDSGRFTRLDYSRYPKIGMTLNDRADPFVKQVSDMLLSSCIKNVRMNAWNFSSDDFLLCTQLLNNSNIGRLDIHSCLQDSSISHIHPFVSHTKTRVAVYCHDMDLSDSAAFIEHLASSGFSSAFLLDYKSSASSFFGISHAFWKQFLNEKLANGSFEFVETAKMGGRVTEAPIVLPDSDIGYLEWQRKMKI